MKIFLKTKEPNSNYGTTNEKDFQDGVFGSNLDTPKSELDDEQEQTGSEKNEK